MAPPLPPLPPPSGPPPHLHCPSPPPPASIFVAAAATVAAIRLAQRGDVLAPRSLCRALCGLPATPGGSAGRLPTFVRSNTW